MNITILGGGPAGLYCALLLKKANATHDITLIERNAPDATYGWGVVFSDRTLASFREADHKTYTAITDHFVTWDAIDTYVGGELVRCGGHVFAGLARKQLLAILQRRCRELGVSLRFNTDIADPTQPGIFSGSDLLIAADGVNSLVRAAFADIFKPSLVPGNARYIWLGTDKVLDAFTFIFRENEHGFFQVHAYPFDGTTSTFIVECAEDTWRRAGLDSATEGESIAYCEHLFAEELRGARLLPNNSKWISFVTVKNATWRHGNIVLLGDSAHTAHFSIGSGTKLAMEDAIALANAIEQHPDLATALREYEAERRPIVETLQEAARESQRYFEGVSRYRQLAPIQFTFNLLTRSGRVTYDDLRLRDVRFGEAVDTWFESNAIALQLPPSPEIGHFTGIVSFNQFCPPPLFTPFNLRDFTLRNRAVLRLLPASNNILDSRVITPWSTNRANLDGAALAGPGLILTEPVAISADGRITPEDAGIYTDEHLRLWTEKVQPVHLFLSRPDQEQSQKPRARQTESQPAQAAGAAGSASTHSPVHSSAILDRKPIAMLGIVLNHAGRRGAVRPIHEARGLDRPLRENASHLLLERAAFRWEPWPLVSASALPYTPRSQTPAALDRAGMDRVRGDFVRAAQSAHAAGFDLLMLHMGHGYLLASFLSPLTNIRDDDFGGTLENRLRFPLEVFDAVRAVWPAEKPLAAALTCDDWAPGGISIEEAIQIARMLKSHGCDLIQVLAGQTIPDPVTSTYGHGFLTPLSDRIRNEAGIPTLVGGYLPTTNDVNTILAAGRADLCIVDFTHRSPVRS
ncbi:MAG TPA: FAD-dependent monooxygenase [Ktedonobacterales bacterium]|nr:FAD-dependent monooxygenase [Ktedonobacterales bacterium]